MFLVINVLCCIKLIELQCKNKACCSCLFATLICVRFWGTQAICRDVTSPLWCVYKGSCSVSTDSCSVATKLLVF